MNGYVIIQNEIVTRALNESFKIVGQTHIEKNSKFVVFLGNKNQVKVLFVILFQNGIGNLQATLYINHMN